MRLLAVLFTAAAFAQTPDFEARVIEDSSGNPLASAEVRFHRIGIRELAADLDTDRQGNAAASGLPPGEYTIDVLKPNYVTASMRVRLPAPASVVVRMVRYAIVSGQVTDSQGRPALGRIQAPYGRTIGGARIAILAATETGGSKTVREVDLGEEGRYRIFDLTPGAYTVGLWYDGLKDGSGVMLYPDTQHPRVLNVAGGEEFRDIDFQLVARAAYQVSGKVQLPKPKTKVALALGLPEQPLLPIAQTLTNDDGTFRFDRVPPGTYDLFAAGPDAGYSSHHSVLGPEPLYTRTRISVGGANVPGLDLTLTPGRSIVVKLANGSSDKPPDGCPQSASVIAELLEPWGVRLPGNTAQFAFGKEQPLLNLPPGRFQLTAGGLGLTCFQPDPSIVDLSRDPAGPVLLQLASAGLVRGVLRGDHPADYTVVLLESDPSPDAQAKIATPTADGKFSFDGLRPGRYRIAAQSGKTRWIPDVTRMIEIKIPGGVPTDIDLPVPPAGGRQ